jgi:soluble lytic murein transglycosylase-like protein
MTPIKSLLHAAGAAALIAGSPLLAQSDDAIESNISASPSQPSVLSAAQKLAYGEIFAKIHAGDWAGAAARLDAMGDGPLHPTARAELYLAKGSPKVELEPLMALLAKAPEIPQAAQLGRLAEIRGAAALPNLPQAQRLIWVDGQPRRARARSVKGDAVAAELEKQVQPLIVNNQPAAAEALLVQQQNILTPEALTEYRQRIGWSYYIVGDDASARRLADLGRAGVGEWTLQAEWLAGLAAWRMRDCNAAAASFAAVGARSTDIEFSAAGHYWAARADMMCGRPEQVQARLRMAARMDETFYGLLARSALGIRSTDVASARRGRDWRSIAGRPNVQAAIALAEIGERSLAEEAIRYQCKIRPQDHQALLRLAADLDLPSAQIWLAHNVPPGTHVEMAARYPAPDWKPSHGWRVDPPLVYAHTLQESGFRTDVVSAAGATGLMQVRPGTAGDIARGRGERFDPQQLTNPSDNIEFGQTYLEYLRDSSGTGGLLPKVIAAYNAGPAPVAEWNARDFGGGDPLLYIESIPYWETRGYVPIILRNYWVYEQEAGRERSSSREALVQGLWPRFPGMKGATAVRLTPRNFAAADPGDGSD